MKKVLLLATMIVACMCAYAQNALSLAKFDAPKRLITAKNGKVNVRQRPDSKAQIIKTTDDFEEWYNVQINKNTLYEVVGETDGWYKIAFFLYGTDGCCFKNEGYVSKSVTRESPITSLGDFNCDILKYEEDKKGKSVSYEYLSETASSQFPYIMVIGTDYDNFVDMKLLIGKKIGDVIVFKYPTYVNMRMARTGYKGEDVIKDGTITFSTEHDSKSLTQYHRYGEITIFDFSKYTDSQLEEIFGDEVQMISGLEKGDESACSEAIYLNAEWIKR